MTTFLNGDSNTLEEGKKSLSSVANDISYYMEDLNEDYSNEELPAFYEYGLSFEYVPCGTYSDQKQGYYTYLISYGGPSEEIRFHHDGSIEFVYLNWGVGVGFDVTNQDWADWLMSLLKNMGAIDWDSLQYEDIICD